VLRLCSVFEAPAGALASGARFDPVGGMQSHTGQLTRALDARGLAQTVVTAWRPGAARNERLGERSQVVRLGLPLRRWRQLYSLPAGRALPALAAEADLVHVHLGEDLAVVPLGLAAARRHRLPTVLTVHCSPRHTLVGNTPRALLLRTLGGLAEAWGERRADAVIALTDRLAGRLLEAGLDPGRVHVIPSGVDPGRFVGPPADPAPELPRPRVLFVGRLAPQKGVRTLLEAVPLLRHRDVPVLLVGDGPERGRLERRAAGLGLAGRVRFLGFATPRQVTAWLCHADVLVLPSVYEELGSVLLEAMAAGLPVVASAVGGIPAVVRDGGEGLLVPPGEPPALAAAVDRVLGDRALAGRLARAATERAAAFHWDRLAEQVLEVYRGVVAPRRLGSAVR
jgi:glycogen synthase